MGASCAVKGSKSHPCHCCSYLASPGASVQQQQQQHHHHRHHHHHHETHHAHHQHHHHHHPVGKQSATELQQPQNNNGDCNILAPLRSKMKVLKKLKRKIGLAPRSSNAGTNNMPPLTFHQVHGENVRLCNGGTIARRYESFCRGITFSARPVRVGEKVCVKFLELSNNWSGVIRFGFTSNDPINLQNGLPRYACPDLTNKPGYWAKAMTERLAERGAVLFYYVTSAGDVHFGMNGEEKGVFFGGVETRGPLWALIDVYGNCTAIEFVDPNRQHFNNIRRGAEHSNEDNAQHSRHTAMDDASNASRDIRGEGHLERVIPSMQSMSIHHEHDVELPGLRFQPAGVIFTPLPFHPTRGRNILFSNQQCVATRTDIEFCHGYAFTSRPLLLGERLVVQILATEPLYLGALALGLTSCDPARITAEDLPDDSDLLLDRPEYWVVFKDVASNPQPGDEIAFTVTHFGEVQMSKNGGPPNVVLHVDQSLQLWAFFDVYGSTQRVRMLAERPSSPPRQRQTNPSPQSSPPLTGTMASTGSSTYVEPVNYQSLDGTLTSQASSHLQQWSESLQPTPGQPSECSVCYERSIDSVLYMCGHMCMCYPCAIQQWCGKGGGHCPLCRATIRDVIRIYRS
ncbi:Protein neuralized [Habropoda laboriosa]|uniref:Protein neuralized n=1 Tax=Habropoda laboriosa TaxID=597456 RepID=A0A0L7QLT1_9HYME|nr:Protein neuralized [Habropoda laboriosa]